MGPALSWPELAAVAFNGLPGGNTDDPTARLLPALGDDQGRRTAHGTAGSPIGSICAF
jgi:hypothetical protein